MEISDFFDRTFAGNTVTLWLWAIGTIVVVVGVLATAKYFVLRRLRPLAGRTRTQADDVIIVALERTRTALGLWIVLTIALRILSVTPEARTLLGRVAVLAFLVQLGIWANGLIEFWMQRYTRERVASDATSVTTMRAVAYGVRVLAWSIVLLLALDNLGVNVTALITGLGIGGVAVALAVQNVLGDVFAALAIVLDKPFVLGDFIIVGSEKGTVEHIGIKTTRLRSLDGEQIIFSNAELLGSRIRNYKRMEERRVLFRFGVLYSTSQEKLEALPGIAREAVLAQSKVRFDRAHFATFGDSALELEVVYYVLSPDYSVYMDTQQAINLTLFRRLNDEGVGFAFPTRTLHIEGRLDGPRETSALVQSGDASSAER
jgi:small-conductance mechanosensitive channel